MSDDAKKLAEAIKNGASVIACSIGCCQGCERCYGMSLGCHQDPCRCSFPCICDFKDEDSYRPGCVRHDMSEDLRQPVDYEEPDIDDLEANGLFIAPPCPECGQYGACGNDEMGRPMIHLVIDHDGEQGS